MALLSMANVRAAGDPTEATVKLVIVCLDPENWVDEAPGTSLVFAFRYPNQEAKFEVPLKDLLSAETPLKLEDVLKKGKNAESQEKNVLLWWDEFQKGTLQLKNNLDEIRITVKQKESAGGALSDKTGGNRMHIRVVGAKTDGKGKVTGNKKSKSDLDPDDLTATILNPLILSSKESKTCLELQIWKRTRPEGADSRIPGDPITTTIKPLKPSRVPEPVAGRSVEIEFVPTIKGQHWGTIGNLTKINGNSLPLAVRLSFKAPDIKQRIEGLTSGYRLKLPQRDFDALSSIEVGFQEGARGFPASMNDYCRTKKLAPHPNLDYKVEISEKKNEKEAPEDVKVKMSFPLSQDGGSKKKLYMYVKQVPAGAGNNSGEQKNGSVNPSPGGNDSPPSDSGREKVQILFSQTVDQNWSKIAARTGVPLPLAVRMIFSKPIKGGGSSRIENLPKDSTLLLSQDEFHALLSIQVGFRKDNQREISRFCPTLNAYLKIPNQTSSDNGVADFEVLISGKEGTTIPDDADTEMHFPVEAGGAQVKKLWMYAKEVPSRVGRLNLGIVCLDSDKWKENAKDTLAFSLKLSDDSAEFKVPLKDLLSKDTPWKLDDVLRMDVNPGSEEKVMRLWNAFKKASAQGGAGEIVLKAVLQGPNKEPLENERTKTIHMRVVGAETASKGQGAGSGNTEDKQYTLTTRINGDLVGRNDNPILELQIWKDNRPDWAKYRILGENISVSKNGYSTRPNADTEVIPVPVAKDAEITFIQAIKGENWNAITTNSGGALPLAARLTLKGLNSKDRLSIRALPLDRPLMLSTDDFNSISSVEVGFQEGKSEFCANLNAYLKSVNPSRSDSGAVDYEVVISGKEETKVPDDAVVKMTFTPEKRMSSKKLYIYARQVGKSGPGEKTENSTLRVMLPEANRLILTPSQREKLEWGLRKLLRGNKSADPKVNWDSENQRWMVSDFELPPNRESAYLHSREDSELFMAGSGEQIPNYFVFCKNIPDDLGNRLELSFTDARVIDGSSVVKELEEKLGINEFVDWHAIPLNIRKEVIGTDVVTKHENMGGNRIAIASARQRKDTMFYQQTAVFRSGEKTVMYDGVLDMNELGDGKAMPDHYANLEKIMGAWKVEVNAGPIVLSALDILKAMPRKPSDGLLLSLKPPAGTENMLKWLSADKAKGALVETALAAEARDPSAAIEGTMLLVDNYRPWSADATGTRAKIWDAVESWLEDRGDSRGPVVVGIFGGKCQEFPPEVLRDSTRKYAAFMEFRRQEFSEYAGLGFGSPPWAWSSLLNGKDTDGVKDADRALLLELLRKARKWNIVAICPPLGSRTQKSSASEQSAQEDIGKEWAKRSVNNPLPESLRKMTLLIISREGPKKEASQQLPGKMNVRVIPAGNDIKESLRKAIGESLKP